MQVPKLPSFFKNPKNKSFSFKPRYYDENKERIKQLKLRKKINIKFSLSDKKTKLKARNQRIIFLIIILSLLSYNLIKN
tara:strand:- start:542 stop:778 length:237 start_codon:yes stop_codon:yes gene_type:complete